MNYNQADSPGSFVGRMNAVTDLLNIYFVCIDKSILESKTVKNGLEPVVEYVSLLFAGQFGDSRLMKYDTKFDTVIAKYGEELKTMSGYYSEVEEIVAREVEAAAARGRADGKDMGIALGKIETLVEEGYSDEEIIVRLVNARNNPLTAEEAMEYLLLYKSEV